MLIWVTTLVSFCISIGVAYLVAALSPPMHRKNHDSDSASIRMGTVSWLLLKK